MVLIIGVIAASTASIFIRYAQADGTPSLAIAAIRLSMATAILTPIALRQDGASALKQLSRHELLLALLSGTFLAIHFASWITSLEHVSVLVSVVLVDTSPLWVAAFSPTLLKEPLTRRVVIAIIIAFAGGVFVSLNDAATLPGPEALPWLGSLLALVGAITVALYLIIGRRLRATLNVLHYIWLVYGTAAIVLLLMTLLARMPLTGYTPETYFWILMMALIPQLIGHTSFNYALGALPAAYVSLVTLGEPIGSAILAYFLLSETPAPVQIGGAALVLLAVVLAREPQSKPQPVTPSN